MSSPPKLATKRSRSRSVSPVREPVAKKARTEPLPYAFVGANEDGGICGYVWDPASTPDGPVLEAAILKLSVMDRMTNARIVLCPFLEFLHDQASKREVDDWRDEWITNHLGKHIPEALAAKNVGEWKTFDIDSPLCEVRLLPYAAFD